MTLTAKQISPARRRRHGEVRWDAVVVNGEGKPVATYDVLTMVAKTWPPRRLRSGPRGSAVVCSTACGADRAGRTCGGGVRGPDGRRVRHGGPGVPDAGRTVPGDQRRRGRAGPGHLPGDRGAARRDPRRHGRGAAGRRRRVRGAGHAPGRLLRPARGGAGRPCRWSARRSARRPAELARNPFRMFTSMLVPEDRRFFDADSPAGSDVPRPAPTVPSRPARPGRRAIAGDGLGRPMQSGS